MVKESLTALTLLVATAAAAATPTLDYTRRAIASLPVHKDDRDYADKAEQLERIAAAVAERAEKPPAGIAPRQWAALMLTVGYRESGFSQRIIEHRCKARECDRGRAKGIGQPHRNTLNADDWDKADGNIEIQVKMLDDGLRRSFWNCRRSGVPFPQATLSSYAGQRCSAQWRGLEQRLETFNGLVKR